jgi:alkylhydroperoxidase/carboxymuconolactone decarboxylase family protein YurZ
LKNFNTLKTQYILPLIAAASALRKTITLKTLINLAKSRKIPFCKIYETLLQNYLFTGYPSAFVSLKILKSTYPGKKLDKTEDMNLYHFRKRGELNCRKVYGDKYDKLIRNIADFSPDLSDWLILEGYGKVLSRKGLSFKERELCSVSVLSVLKFEDQLFSHIKGAYRAKASIEEIQNVMKNNSLMGNRNLSAFGLKVLNRFKKEKGMYT